jgi:hypothetical protein
MAEVSLSLVELFEKAFQYKTQAFEPRFKTVTGDGDTFSDRKEYSEIGSPYYAIDPFNREYFMPVTLSYPASTENNNDVMQSWELPHPIISINSKKNIVETQLVERRGTVKELINIEDYEIIIKGFIVAQTHEFPEKEVARLRKLYEFNVPLSIQCPITDIFLLRPDRNGSDQVIIKELKFPAVKGIKNVRPYELLLVSDAPFNLVSIA